MAITYVGGSDGDYGGAPNGNKVAEAATTINLSGSLTALVDDVIILTIAADNAGTSGVSAYSSIDQPSTGAVTWEAAQVVNRTAGSAANDGATLIMIVGRVTSEISTSSTVVVNWSPNVTAKAWRPRLIRGASPTIQSFASATGTGTTPTVTSGSSPVRAVLNGDIVIGAVAVESATAVTTSDTDTTNGSWLADLAASSGGTGGDGTKMSSGSQTKIVTADGAQTYNVTVTNTDRAIAILALGVPAGGTNAPAGNAAGTGTANAASIGLAPNAGLSSGTGTANAAAANVQPAAGNAAGVGAAQNAATAIAPAAGVATGTGTAPTPAAGIAPNAGLASGTGTANNATVIFSRDADAGVASGTGAANQPAAGISPNAGLASGTGIANDATVSVTSGTNAPAGLAEGTGTAWTAAPNIQPNAGLAVGTGAAQTPAASVAVNAGLASGTGTANDAAVTTESASGLVAGTGTAQQPSIGVSVNAALASGTGAALDATVAFARDAEAGVAAGTGTANQPAASIAPNAGLAAGTGTALDPTVSTSSGTNAPAGVAAGAGTAWDATVSITPNASVAAGTGAANQPAVGISVNAGLVTGTGTAYGATLPVPVWTTPADTVTMANQPELKFTMPYLAAPLFFELELDKVATFNGGDLREIRSDLSQTGWDFWNGTTWEAVAPTGVPAAYAGNEARHTVQTSLSAGTWYRRVRAGV